MIPSYRSCFSFVTCQNVFFEKKKKKEHIIIPVLLYSKAIDQVVSPYPSSLLFEFLFFYFFNLHGQQGDSNLSAVIGASWMFSLQLKKAAFKLIFLSDMKMVLMS